MTQKFTGGINRDLLGTRVYNQISGNIIIQGNPYKTPLKWSDETAWFLEIILEKILNQYMVMLDAFISNDMGKEMYEEHGDIHVVISNDNNEIRLKKLFHNGTYRQGKTNWEEGRKHHNEKYGNPDVNQDILEEVIKKQIYTDLLSEDMEKQTKVILRHLIEEATKQH